jgi:hypothetical protein
MSWSEIENAYLDRLAAYEFPGTPPAEQEPAKGPEVTEPSEAPAEMKAYDPTTRERIASFLQAGFEGLGMDRSSARKNAQSIIGGPSSGGPLGIGIADIVPLIGTALQTEEASRNLGNAATLAKQGDMAGAAIEAGIGAVGMLPGAIGTVQLGKQAKKMATEIAKTPPVGAINTWISRDEFTAYRNQPRQLQGFKTIGPNKGFDEQKYKHAEFLEVKLDDGTTFYDAIRGLNKSHALSRAFGNWPAASEIRPLARLEAEKADPSLVKEVDAAMGVSKGKK